MRRLSDFLSGWIARMLLAFFYRRIEVQNRNRMPTAGPVVVVANHPNGLIDPGLMLAVLPRPVRFLGKSTLWDIPPLRPFLALTGAIPVYRHRDSGVDTSKNAETFARCRQALVAGEAIALFPEGQSHDDPFVQGIKTGAARIALDASVATETSVSILPVGLAFDRRERFRSRALVYVGHPFTVEEALDEIPEDGAEAREDVRRLTDRIAAALRSVVADYTSWREARLFVRAAEIYGRPGVSLPASRSLTSVYLLSRRLLSAYRELQQKEPARVEEIARRTERYDRAIGRLKLRDAQVAARYPFHRVARWTSTTLVTVLLGLPLGAVGALLSFVPYQIIGQIAVKVGKTIDQMASYKLFGALILYPFFWALEAALAAWIWGPEAGLGLLVAAPVLGYAALHVMERGRRLLAEARAYLLLKRRPEIGGRLRALRESILEEMDQLTLDLGLQERPESPQEARR